MGGEVWGVGGEACSERNLGRGGGGEFVISIIIIV